MKNIPLKLFLKLTYLLSLMKCITYGTLNDLDIITIRYYF